jgi:DNA-binding NarL/FixJ family response regulator
VIRIVLVDDQAIVREGLRAMLSLEPDMIIVGEASGGQEALALVARLRPDIVLMDVRMPDMDGLTALERIKRADPDAAVIMVSLYDDADYLYRAVSAGAAGYILKEASRGELVRAVRLTAEGGSIISPNMLRELLDRMSALMSPAACPPRPGDVALTPREVEVLRCVAEGKTNQEIAEQLIVSATTVKTHVQNILQKLNVSDRTQAAVVALRCGLIE